MEEKDTKKIFFEVLCADPDTVDPLLTGLQDPDPYYFIFIKDPRKLREKVNNLYIPKNFDLLPFSQFFSSD